MLFQTKIDPRCAYCAKGARSDPDFVLCIKKGIVRPESHCGAFRYDPLKRVPAAPRAPDFSKLRDEDFVL